MALDGGHQILEEPGRRQHLHHHEHRADQQTHAVVRKGRLAAFVVVADELDDPADHEETHRPGQPLPQRPATHAVCQQYEQAHAQGRGRAQAQVPACQVPQRHQAEHQPGRRDRQTTEREADAGQQDPDRKDDHRHAHEMGDDVAPVPVVFGVLLEQIDGGAEQACHESLLAGHCNAAS